MPSFTIIVTQDVTQSACVTVKARSAAAAQERAIQMATEGKLEFNLDDGNAYDDPYITGCDKEPA